METILVTVSVLSTLLVVGIVLGIVIVVNKLKGKVDVETFKSKKYDNEREVERIYHELSLINDNINNKTDEIERYGVSSKETPKTPKESSMKLGV